MKWVGMVRTLGLTAIVVTALAAQASAGIKLTFSSTGGATSLIAQGSRLSEVNSLNGVVLDCKSGRMTVWNTKKHAYWQGSSDELLADTESMMADLQKQMGAFQSMAPGGGQKETGAQAKPLGTRTFAGYKAVGYTVRGGGPMAMAQLESWYSSDLEQKIEHETGKCDAFTVLAGMGAMTLGENASQLTSRLAKEHGYVVSQSMSMMGRNTVIRQLQKVEPVDATSSAFAVPDGYTRVQSYTDFLKQQGM